MSQATFSQRFLGGNLVLRIAVGIVAGVLLALAWPDAASSAMLPGNLFVQPGPKVVFVDFGLAKDVPASTRLGYVQLTGGILARNSKTIVQAFHNLGFRVKDDNEKALTLLADSFLGAAVRAKPTRTDGRSWK